MFNFNWARYLGEPRGLAITGCWWSASGKASGQIRELALVASLVDLSF